MISVYPSAYLAVIEAGVFSIGLHWKLIERQVRTISRFVKGRCTLNLADQAIWAY